MEWRRPVKGASVGPEYKYTCHRQRPWSLTWKPCRGKPLLWAPLTLLLLPYDLRDRGPYQHLHQKESRVCHVYGTLRVRLRSLSPGAVLSDGSWRSEAGLRPHAGCPGCAIRHPGGNPANCLGLRSAQLGIPTEGTPPPCPPGVCCARSGSDKEDSVRGTGQPGRQAKTEAEIKQRAV